MSNEATPAATPEFSVAEFIDGQLGMLTRRMKPEERAKVRWWRDRIAILAKQEPGDEPIPGDSKAA